MDTDTETTPDFSPELLKAMGVLFETEPDDIFDRELLSAVESDPDQIERALVTVGQVRLLSVDAAEDDGDEEEDDGEEAVQKPAPAALRAGVRYHGNGPVQSLGTASPIAASTRAAKLKAAFNTLLALPRDDARDVATFSGITSNPGDIATLISALSIGRSDQQVH